MPAMLFNSSVSVAVGDALEQAHNDPIVRAAVLTGTGDESFCTGADLQALARGENLYHPVHPEWGFAGYARHFVDKPTIAVNGTELVLARDLAAADAGATFGISEGSHGVRTAAGGVFRIVDQIPRKCALALTEKRQPVCVARCGASSN